MNIKSVVLLWRYCNFSNFKSGRRRHLGFFEIEKFCWLLGRRGSRRISVPNFVKIGQSVAKILNFFSIFLDGGRPPSWICLGHIWTINSEYLVYHSMIDAVVFISRLRIDVHDNNDNA